jgi:hypothetical protein
MCVLARSHNCRFSRVRAHALRCALLLLCLQVMQRAAEAIVAQASLPAPDVRCVDGCCGEMLALQRGCVAAGDARGEAFAAHLLALLRRTFLPSTAQLQPELQDGVLVRVLCAVSRGAGLRAHALTPQHANTLTHVFLFFSSRFASAACPAIRGASLDAGLVAEGSARRPGGHAARSDRASAQRRQRRQRRRIRL